MAYFRTYDRVGEGLDMSELSNGLGFFSTNGITTVLTSDTRYDFDTNLATFDVLSGGKIKHMGLFYNQDFSGNVVMESVYYYDRNFKPLVDWYDANIFVSYRDLISGSSSWIFDGFNGADTIIGNKYNDIIKSGDLNDVLKGKAGNDRLYGEFGNDKLFGDAGNDRLFGQQGNDDLYGGIGTDHYKGGSGNDDFIFKSISDAGRGGKCDVIDDFDLRRDYVVLSAIDADTTHAGNQSFEFIGKSGFSGDAGELRCRGGIVSGDVNGDASADFHIDVGLQMREIDFVL